MAEPMDRGRWRRIEAIGADALERDPADRNAFLEQACHGDPALLGQVRVLLEGLEREPDFLASPVIGRSASENLDVDPSAPERVGPYRITARLGRGGMGDVYLAVHQVEDLEQRVAVKVIKPGMDTAEVLSRFRLERRILASLHHPNIARLLDAGATEDGRPYFVMELVAGIPIDEFCRLRNLSVADRLGLVTTVCAAVQHAHDNLVVHRDLKPGNIFVAEDGTLKLLDFGIGKVLAPTDSLGSSVETRTDLRLLTPTYAAPEQITGGPITTATDVYAIGILLYELLTERHPYLSPGLTFAEIERAVLHARPSRPSGATRRSFEADLDTIVLKALSKEPSRRYRSVAALAEDLTRYLAGRPVSARPDTFGYRASKFIRRNAGAVAAGTVAGSALVGAVTVTVVQTRRAAVEVGRERDKALEVRSFLMEMFGATGGSQSVGDTISVKRLLDLQSARVGTAYRDEPEIRADMLEVLADGYDRLGLPSAAESLAVEALATRRRLLGPSHLDVATAANLVGWIHHQLGRPTLAEPLLREAVRIRRGAGPRRLGLLGRSLNDLGVSLTAQRKYHEAEESLREALAIRRADPRGDLALGITGNNLAAVFYFQGRLDSAVATQSVAAAALGRALGADHQRSIVALNNLAALRAAAGDWAGVENDYRDLVARQSRLQGRDHPVTAKVLVSLAAVLPRLATGPDDPRLVEASRLLQDAASIYGARLGPTHAEVGNVLGRLAVVRGKMLDTVGAIRAATAAVPMLETRGAAPHPELATALGALCDVTPLTQQSAGQVARYCDRAATALLERTPRDSARIARVRLREAEGLLLVDRTEASRVVKEIRAQIEAGLALGSDQARFDSVVSRLNGDAPRADPPAS